MSNADRQRRYRQRKKAGLRILSIAISEELVAEGVRLGRIDIRATEHDPDLEDAIEALLEEVFSEGKALRVTDGPVAASK